MANIVVVFVGKSAKVKVVCPGINSKHKSLEGCTSSSSKSDHNSGNIFNIDDYINLINQSCKSLEKDTCYEESVRETFKAYDFKIAGKEDEERFSQVKKLSLLFCHQRKG